ncbi:MAG TPA: extracellular solute-binding protein [Chloroflexota bacterium]|nr:extracellular solute-binding protein [Chloroflexota bacterium]
MWTGTHPPHQDNWTKLLPLWQQKQPQVKVTAMQQPDQGTKIQAAVAAGTVPDMQQNLNQLTGMARGWFAPMDDVYRAAKIDPRKDFLASATEAWAFKGKLWGVPLEDGANFVGFTVRHDLLGKAGVKMPDAADKDMPFATWDALYDFARRAVVRGPTPEASVPAWTSALGQLDTVLCAAILESGLKYFDPDRGRWTVNQPGVVDVIKKLFYDPAQTLGIEDPAVSNLGATLSLRQGKTAMTWYGTGAKSEAITAKEEAAPFIETYISPPFKGTARMPVAEGGWGVMVMKDSKKRDQAAPFMTWLAQDPQVGAIWNGMLACRSAPRPGQLDGFKDCQGPEWEGSQRILRLQKSRPSRFIGWESGGTSVGRAAMAPVLKELREGRTTPGAAAALMEEQLNLKLQQLTSDLGPLR